MARPIFTLEALAAKHGDALLLHYGTKADPRLLAIDGGPAGVFKATLGPRLEELRAQRRGGPLAIALYMVSHLDDDHIAGVIDVFKKLARATEDGDPAPYAVTELWHNAFDDVVGPATAARFRAGATSGAAAVVASVGQGRKLRDLVVGMPVIVNHGFAGIVTAPARGPKVKKLAPDLEMVIVGPLQSQIDALQAEWDVKLRKNDWDVKAAARAAAYDDDSVYNLSSIAVLAKVGRKRMLLTGDARGDHLLQGLRAAGLLKTTLHVDLLKVPHHGSDRNVSTEFFRTVTASHYVISGDGGHGNPETAALQMISDARGAARFKVHLTYETGRDGLGPRLEKFFASERRKGKRYEVVFREPEAKSLRVHLGARFTD